MADELIEAGDPQADPVFEVLLSSDVEPERAGRLTVVAKDAETALAWAEQQNPGLTASDATELT
jgi:hypothetical protein